MSYNEFLMPVTGAANDKENVRLAKELFDATNVPVTLFYAQPDAADLLVWSADGLIVGGGVGVAETLQQAAEEVWIKLNALNDYNSPLKLERSKGSLQNILPYRAAIADLLVMCQSSVLNDGQIAPAFEECLIQHHTPILYLREMNQIDFSKILICWDGSVQSARAYKAAIPFIKMAKSVEILQIQDANIYSGSIIWDIKTLANSLACQNIEFKETILKLSAKSVSEELISYSNANNFGLVVAGAYGHSRTREFIFGGVSHSLIHNLNCPNILMAH